MTEKLSVAGLAVAIGAIWGLLLLCAGWMAIFGWGVNFVSAFNFYPGYGPHFIGGIIGGIEGFFDGAVAGAVVALVYNCMVAQERKSRGRGRR